MHVVDNSLRRETEPPPAPMTHDGLSTPLAGPPPPPSAAEPGRYARRSIETLVVVLAAITIIGVVAGIVARLCGGRLLGGSRDNDIEGWVERRCRSCIDSGLPPPEEKPAEAPAPELEQAEKK
ncbi:uncharacterized protein LOC104445124 [Eucalyptus grandis]|uniref:uncharacterized protein LOC104445124 n=1 Tax=Eucalyptus grandis TaxID=71139 RepID=UPI00192F0626|nr:uncharacterized protein LOC104445124 [Eucalyptus grandis]